MATTIEIKNMAEAQSPEIHSSSTQSSSERAKVVTDRLLSDTERELLGAGPDWRTKSGRVARSPDYDPEKDVAGYYVGQPDPQRRYIQVYRDPQTGKEVQRMPRLSGGSVDTTDLFPDIKEEDKAEPSDFQHALETADYFRKAIKSRKLTDDELKRARDRLVETENQINQLIGGAEEEDILKFVKDFIRGRYSEALNLTRGESRRGELPSDDESAQNRMVSVGERIKYIHENLDNYQETFWDYSDAALMQAFEITDPAEILTLRVKYEGIANYIAKKAAIAMDKEFNSGKDVSPDEGIGEAILVEAKERLMQERREAAEKRRRERRLMTAEDRLHWYDWREKFDFTWAETPEELDQVVFDWIEQFSKILPRNAAESVNQAVNKGRTDALSSLEQMLVRLKIKPDSPFALSLRNRIEGYVEVIGGVGLLESGGGFEAFTAYQEDYANNFNGHHDEIYLGNAKSAILQDQLSDGLISLGSSRSTEKPHDRDMNELRSKEGLAAIRYAATHELYISDRDFENADAGIEEAQKEVARMGLSGEAAQRMLDQIIGEKRGRYSWDDPIEEMLLHDSKSFKKLFARTDLSDAEMEAEARKLNLRVGVFQKIKERLDKEDGLFGKTDAERRDIIRGRIKAEMAEQGESILLRLINAMATPEEKDRALWKWVKDYNKIRQENAFVTWFPTRWDLVRLSIDKPTKLIDRALSKEEFRSMVVEVEDEFKGLSDEEIDGRLAQEAAKKIEEETAKIDISILGAKREAEIKRITEVINKQKDYRWADYDYARKRRTTEAERAFVINRAYQKFLGWDARKGGMVARKVNDDGDIEMIRITDKAAEILKDKIDLEEEQIEKQVLEFERKLEEKLRKTGRYSKEYIEDRKIKRKRLLRRNATFGATLALREMGVANDLPIWDYYFFSHSKMVDVVAPYMGFTHGYKPVIADRLDRGRREMRAVFDYLAAEYMDGRILVIEEDPDTDVDPVTGEIKSHHREVFDRARVVNEGGSPHLRDVFETQFMLSTSGGVELPELITKITHSGVYDLLWERGCLDFREFQGFIKRRDESDLREQTLWNTTEWEDPTSYAKSLREAAAAKTFLTGGTIKGQGKVAGVLQEPMQGAWKYRSELLNPNVWLKTEIKGLINHDVVNKMEGWKTMFQEVLDNPDNQDKISQVEIDNLVKIGAEIISPIIQFMDAREYVMKRGGGRTPNNWKLDNELIVKAYLDVLLNSNKNENVGPDHLDYAAAGRSAIAIGIYRNLLKTASYHLLSEQEKNNPGQHLELDKHAKEAQKKLEDERARIEAEPLPANVISMIAKRKEKLREKEATEANIEREAKRLEEQYKTEQLHRRVVGEWAAAFASEEPVAA